MKYLVACAAALVAVAAAASAAPVKEMKAANGTMILTGENGMTLYTFKKDTAGVSNCAGDCAKNWPPLMAKEDDPAKAPYSIIERAGDTYQWAKDGMPLYFWIKDKKPGDVTGDGVNNVWDVARP